MNRALLLPFAGVVIAGLVIAGWSTPVASPADTVLVNGTIYTVDPGRPQVQALAIRRGRLLVLGSDDDVLASRGPETTVIDLGGRAVVPGLHDAHGHVAGLGQSLEVLDLRRTRDVRELAARVAARAAETPAGTWIVGRGWDQNTWPGAAWPTAADLDAVTPDHPVLLTRVDGHAALVNTRAIEAAGITADTPDPEGGRVIRGADGGPTGVLVDAAVSLVSRHVPPPTPEAIRRRVALADATMARLGITTVHDAGVPLSTVRLYRAMADEGALSTRIYAMLPASALKDGVLPPPLIGYATHQLNVRAVKLVADGALGSRGAHLLAPYADDPSTSGLAVTPAGELYEQVLAAVRAGYQPAVHAIGDRANRALLDVFERVQREVPASRQLRMRNEHAQILHPDDIPRFAALDVIASMQPTHATSDMAWVPARLGETRTRGAYVWQTLLESGARVAAGSDFPVEDPDPMLGFYAAVTRQRPDGQPEGGWMPAERMTREQALRSFTSEAAYAAHLEADLGMLRAGKLADLVVLSRDIMRIPAGAIPGTRAVLTMVGGRIVHRDGL